MIENILYTITLFVKPFIVVTVSMLMIGFFLYHLTKKFNIHKKSTRYLGLLTGINKKQIIELSAILIRTILVIYAVLDHRKSIEAILVMVITSEIIYIILAPKKFIFEIINIAAQSTIIYFTEIIHNYRIEISNENYILQVEIALTIFIISYAIYFFLKNIEDIIKPKKERRQARHAKR